MNLIDTHAHIFAPEFQSDLSDIVNSALEKGVNHILMPNIDYTTIDAMLKVEQQFPMCKAMMGLHPCSVKNGFEKDLYVMESWLSKRTFCAIGETGTDLYWDKTFWEQQVEALKIQIRWAIQYAIPIVIHSRHSIDETLDIIESFAAERLTGVFHCFSGTTEQANRIAKLNFYVGIGGVVTFKNSTLKNTLPEVPKDKIVLETDSPYLAPEPHRGKRNMPAYLSFIASAVATALDESTESIGELTSQNARTLFLI